MRCCGFREINQFWSMDKIMSYKSLRIVEFVHKVDNYKQDTQ